MVGNAFKVADQPKVLRSKGTVGLPYFAGAQFDKITADDVLVMIGAGFILPDMLGGLRGAGQNRPETFPHRLHGIAGHIRNKGTAALQCKGRGSQQTFVQFRFPLGLFVLRDKPHHQLFQHPAQRQQHQSAKHIKDGMGNGDAPFCGRLCKQQRGSRSTDNIKQDYADCSADDVKIKVDQRSPTGVFIGADGGKQRRDAGTDILPHNNGDGRPEGDLSRTGKGLQNADRRRAGLDDPG